MKDKEKVLVVFSGGQDSTICLYWALSHGFDVSTITFNYGQRHHQELESAKTILQMAQVKNSEFVDINGCLRGGALMEKGIEVPEGLQEGIATTWVPMRNALFLTIAVNRALVQGIPNVVTGVSQVDYSGYPDCRMRFINMFESMAFEATEKDVMILTPLITMNKSDEVRLARGLNGCWEALAYSHTCYNGKVIPCGTCPACILREKGFEDTGYVDPLKERLQGLGWM